MTGRALVAALLVALAVLTAAGAAASPQPDPVCRACGSSFEQVADDYGYDVTVVNSTATVRVHENGSATWTATNRLAGGDADTLAEPDAAESVARATVDEGWGLPHVYEAGSLTVESVSVEERSVTVRFTDPDAGARRLGTLVVDYFHSDGVQGGWTLDVDEFTLVGPPNATVLNDPAGAVDEGYSSGDVTAAVDGGRLTLRGSLDEEFGPVFSEDLYVVYGDPGTADWRVTGATTLSTAPIWLGNLGSFVVPTMFVFGGVLFVVVVGVDALLSSGSGVSPRQVAALGGLAVAAVTVVPNGRWLVGLAAAYLVVGGGALAAPRLLRSVRGAAALGLASLVAVGGASIAQAALMGGGVVFERVVELAVSHLPLATGLLVGRALAVYRVGDRLRPVLFGAAVALTGWFVAGAVYVPFASTPFGLILVIMGAGAVAGALAAAPLVALTARASEDRAAEPRAADAQGEPAARS
ncbi:hypothetical protein I7X12_09425 [Halosimplex litoreum]|uniref:Uncharacterized protein n=1 Tax=Halosimplex litoreum TaxID=1198301 RepID=A0A7U3WB05_9EURY|nr:hypothetical protein [Halosimplex litoreum]QPV64800.1 hypothetical protein I7X12_09425 [Halosimplex litoreum]